MYFLNPMFMHLVWAPMISSALTYSPGSCFRFDCSREQIPKYNTEILSDGNTVQQVSEIVRYFVC